MDIEATDGLHPMADRSMIADWQTAHTAATERRAKAAADLAEAEKAHRKAAAVSERAVNGDGDAMVAEDALTAAATVLRVASKVHGAAEAAFAKSRDRELTVRGLAHKPVYEAGIKARVAAAGKADAARAALAAAEAEYHAATATMRAACVGGCSDIHGALDAADILRTEDQERAHWISRRVDPDAPVNPWQPE